MEIQSVDQISKVGKVQKSASVDPMKLTNQAEFVSECVAMLHEMAEMRPEILALEPASTDPMKIAEAMQRSVI